MLRRNGDTLSHLGGVTFEFRFEMAYCPLEGKKLSEYGVRLQTSRLEIATKTSS